MAKEYIEREALYNGLVKAYSVLRNMCLGLYMDSQEDARRAERFQPMLNAFLYCIRKVKSVPAVDVVEVKHGEWIYGDFDIPHCSECGNEVLPNQISKFCPNCGAKMDGERREK